MMDFGVNFVGMQDIIAANTTSINLDWQAKLPRQEKNRTNEPNNSTIFYKYTNDEVSKLRETKDGSERLLSSVNWISFKQQFFSSTLISENGFANADISTTTSGEEEDDFLPVLAPMSRIGGRMAVYVAARLLQNDHGGRGILLGDVAAVPSPEVVILGAGTVGSTAAIGFINAGVQVTVLDVSLERLQRLHDRIHAPVVTMLSTPYNINRACSYADVLLGAVLVPGQRTPIVVTREMVANMKPRSIIIDMSIDQGGCVETSRPTDHGSPTYVEEGVVHYCVPNMSGVLGRTATHVFYNGAYPYLEALAKLGVDQAIDQLPALERGVNVRNGEILHMKRLGGMGGMIK